MFFSYESFGNASQKLLGNFFFVDIQVDVMVVSNVISSEK